MIYQVKQNTEDIAELKKENIKLKEEVEYLKQQFDTYIKQPTFQSNSFAF